MKTEAEFLTVQGKCINVGDTYYTVNTYSPFRISKNLAGCENNITQCYYFFNESEAQHCKRLFELQSLTNVQLNIIGATHKGR